MTRQQRLNAEARGREAVLRELANQHLSGEVATLKSQLDELTHAVKILSDAFYFQFADKANPATIEEWAMWGREKLAQVQ